MIWKTASSQKKIITITSKMSLRITQVFSKHAREYVLSECINKHW